MLESFKDRIPVLVPMFEQFNSIVYQSKLMSENDYSVMEQVCIAKDFRGKAFLKVCLKK